MPLKKRQVPAAKELSSTANDRQRIATQALVRELQGKIEKLVLENPAQAKKAALIVERWLKSVPQKFKKIA